MGDFPHLGQYLHDLIEALRHHLSPSNIRAAFSFIKWLKSLLDKHSTIEKDAKEEVTDSARLELLMRDFNVRADQLEEALASVVAENENLRKELDTLRGGAPAGPNGLAAKKPGEEGAPI